MTGKTDPRRRELARLARLFGVSVDYLALDELEEPGGDGLGETQRRVLWAAETVGYEVAIRRIMNAPGSGEAGVPDDHAREGPDGPGAEEEADRAGRDRPRGRGDRGREAGGAQGRKGRRRPRTKGI
jgi:hypothetical protein